jgi:hypothetical protein
MKSPITESMEKISYEEAEREFVDKAQYLLDNFNIDLGDLVSILLNCEEKH